VERQFVAVRPNQLWVVDFTYVAPWSGCVYVAFCIDVFARLITGWRVSGSMTTDLVLDALEMGMWQRQRGGHSLQGLSSRAGQPSPSGCCQ
jgi:putative transposase